MKNTKLTAAVLALIAAVVFSPAAMASGAPVGDLVLGMYDTTGTATSNFELDLGTFGNLSYGETWNLGTDISTVFASTPSTSDIVWAIAATGYTGISGAGGLAKQELAITLPSTSSTATLGSNTTPSTNIDGVDSAYNSGSTTAVGAGFSILDGNSNSFQSRVNDNAGNYGLASHITGGILATYATGVVAQLDLIPSGTNTSLIEKGDFTFNSTTGVLTYEAVPEPSTYALMGVGLLAFVWMMKRRASSTI